MTDDAQHIRTWLERVMKQTGLKPTPFAKEAGLAPSTVLRALETDNPTALEHRSISKIVAKFGVSGPYAEALGGAPGPAGFAEPELLYIDDPSPSFAGRPLAPNEFVRHNNTRALELAGIMPGDRLLFNMAVMPGDGDIVAANVYNFQRGDAETVLRLYEPPYLMPRTMDSSVSAKPMLVDNERVKIMAVMTDLWRSRA